MNFANTANETINMFFAVTQRQYRLSFDKLAFAARNLIELGNYKGFVDTR